MAGPYYVDGAVGSDDNDGDAPGEGNAWATIDKAMNTVAAGEKVWVKASATYTENPIIDTAGVLASPIAFEGYTTTPGDGGRATVVGEIQDSITGRLYYVFKNFDVSNVGGAGSGKCVDLSGTETCWKNCKFHDNNAGALVVVGNAAFFERCEFNTGVAGGVSGSGMTCVGCTFNGNTASAVNSSSLFVGLFCEFNDTVGDGIVSSNSVQCFKCKFYRNSLSAIDVAAFLTVIECEFFSNGSAAVDGGAANESFLTVVNCTVDGDSKDTTDGVVKNIVIHGTVTAVNNIIYDCINGMEWGAGGTHNNEFGISLNNLMYGNTTRYSGGAFTSDGEVTAAPQFVNEVANDYSLASGSPARGAGFDLDGDQDIGANQFEGGESFSPLYPWYVGGP